MAATVGLLLNALQSFLKDKLGFLGALLGGIGEVVADLIENRVKIETRHVTLGHLQRGGPPSAYDRVLATRFGIKAGELVLTGQFGYMSSLKGNDITAVKLSDAVAANRRLDPRYYEEAKEFFP